MLQTVSLIQPFVNLRTAVFNDSISKSAGLPIQGSKVGPLVRQHHMSTSMWGFSHGMIPNYKPFAPPTPDSSWAVVRYQHEYVHSVTVSLKSTLCPTNSESLLAVRRDMT